MDIILGHPRRRWSAEEKRALVAETLAPGVTVSGVAKRHGVNPGMLFSWRKQFRDALAGSGPEAPLGFAEVSLPASPPALPNALPVVACEGRVSVEFASGARMTVSGPVDPALIMALTKLLTRDVARGRSEREG